MSGSEETLAGHVLASRYRVERPIGRGGMGAVYRAIDQRLGRPVALKVIMVPGADAATQERLKQRFLREAQAAARLRHPNVVTVHDFGTDDAAGLDYLVMELLEGEDLARRTTQGGLLAPSAALAVVSQAARGLAAGHRSGMVHRDVKPGNLFLELDEHGEVQVRVLDFGIAQVAWDEPTLIAGGRDPLSPTYAAPEQLRGDPRITPAADVFSLAAVALYLLNGQRPFTGDAATQAAEAEAALARLDSVPEVTPAVRDVLRRALEQDPERRWGDANDFRRALEAAHGGGLDTLPASVMGVARPDAGPGGVDDDVTLFATPGDDRTLFADAPAPAPAGPPSRRVPPPPSVAGRTPDVAPRRGSRAPAVLATLGLLAAGGGALAYYQPWEAGTPDAPPVIATPDSVVQDSLEQLAEADSVERMRRQQDLIQAAVDSVRQADSLAREEERLAQTPPIAGPDPAVDGSVPPTVMGPVDPDVYDLSMVERQPELRNRGDVGRFLERNYPPIMRDSRVPGEVQVSFVVGTNGRVERQSVQVLSSTHPAFEEPAIRAVERMRFAPAQADGRRVRVRVMLPIQFTIG